MRQIQLNSRLHSTIIVTDEDTVESFYRKMHPNRPTPPSPSKPEEIEAKLTHMDKKILEPILSLKHTPYLSKEAKKVRDRIIKELTIEKEVLEHELIELGHMDAVKNLYTKYLVREAEHMVRKVRVPERIKYRAIHNGNEYAVEMHELMKRVYNEHLERSDEKLAVLYKNQQIIRSEIDQVKKYAFTKGGKLALRMRKVVLSGLNTKITQIQGEIDEVKNKLCINGALPGTSYDDFSFSLS